MEESERIRQRRDIDDSRDEVLNPESESMETGRDNADQQNSVRNNSVEDSDKEGSKKAEPNIDADRQTIPLTNRKIEQDKREREKELQHAEEENRDKQQKKEERQKEWGE